MRLRSLSVVLAFVLLLVLAYTAWWASAAWQLRAGIDRWVEAQRASGAMVSYTDLSIGGFPLELAVNTRDALLRLPDGTEASAAGIAAAADTWSPLDVRLTVMETPRVSLPAGPESALVLAAESATGTAGLDTFGRVRQGTLALSRLTITPPGADMPLNAATAELATTLPALPPATHTDPLGTLGLQLSGLVLPDPTDPVATVLGPEIKRAAISATILGGLPPNPRAADLRAWSEDGGTVEMTGLALDWGELSLRGDATLALDGSLQPIGAGTLLVGGTDALLKALVASDLLAPQQAAQLRPFIEFLAQPREDGTRRVSLPVTLQDRRLSLGPMAVATVPSLVWPE